MEGHKSKKPTKKQMIEEVIPKQYEQKLKDIHIKGMVQGFEVANQMLMEYAESHTIEEVVDFCKKNVEQKNVMSKVVSGVKETEDCDKDVEEFKEKV